MNITRHQVRLISVAALLTAATCTVSWTVAGRPTPEELALRDEWVAAHFPAQAVRRASAPARSAVPGLIV